MKSYNQLYRDELLLNVLPFWEDHSIDVQHGGYFTCLLQKGEVYDSDKFIWLQARQVWTFAKMYNQVEPKSTWLHIARHGADFLEKHGRAPNGDWYFSLDQKGQPLIQPYNIFSDCFAAMAFGQLFEATGEERYARIAKTTFARILERQDNPKGAYNKHFSGTRPLRNFALPMILCNLSLELEALLPVELVDRTIRQCLHDVMEVFYKPERGFILENVRPDGSTSDSFDGRLLNPGHGIEAMWFIMDLGKRLDDHSIIERATAITLETLDYAWDEKYGGIFYFLDAQGHPPQQLEWDQKLWWVHLETLVALLKGYQYTGAHICWQQFEKVHQYTWKNFRDPEYEWYGYLNRRGEVLLPLKGGKWKGCFHVPRGLLKCWQALEALEK